MTRGRLTDEFGYIRENTLETLMTLYPLGEEGIERHVIAEAALRAAADIDSLRTEDRRK